MVLPDWYRARIYQTGKPLSQKMRVVQVTTPAESRDDGVAVLDERSIDYALTAKANSDGTELLQFPIAPDDVDGQRRSSVSMPPPSRRSPPASPKQSNRSNTRLWRPIASRSGSRDPVSRGARHVTVTLSRPAGEQ